MLFFFSQDLFITGRTNVAGRALKASRPGDASTISTWNTTLQ